ncbi:DUF1622 domain-containing protein [Hymenobacter aerophilus]|uniref:DUF1622 domain-containing protein n=1 Tax=Hymenobacter aerophilus TaxID=119644 RepID=UPI0003688981|nr:DUF1622 domain-containing protein [Hymenobacter aerophilus]
MADTVLPNVSNAYTQVEDAVVHIVLWLKLGAEAIGAGIIVLGIILAGVLFAKALLRRQTADFNAIRLTLARYLALALEFQLGADILSTTIAPSWEQIGKLGAIAVIRTALNFFLSREMKDEHRTAAEHHIQRKAHQQE